MPVPAPVTIADLLFDAMIFLLRGARFDRAINQPDRRIVAYTRRRRSSLRKLRCAKGRRQQLLQRVATLGTVVIAATHDHRIWAEFGDNLKAGATGGCGRRGRRIQHDSIDPSCAVSVPAQAVFASGARAPPVRNVLSRWTARDGG